MGCLCSLVWRASRYGVAVRNRIGAKANIESPPARCGRAFAVKLETKELTVEWYGAAVLPFGREKIW